MKPHDFRHTRTTILCKKGLPEYVVKEMLGWEKNSNMLSQYNHSDLKDYEEIIKGTDNSIKTVEQYKEENQTLTNRVKDLEEKLNTILERLG